MPYSFEDFRRAGIHPIEKSRSEQTDVDLTDGSVVAVDATLRKKLNRTDEKSEQDYGCVLSLLEAGISPRNVYATFAASARGKDAAGRHSNFDDYLTRTIRKASAFVKPNDDVIGESDGSDWREMFDTRSQFLHTPPMKWVLKGIAQEEETTIIGGLAKHGKTWIMLAIARSRLTGIPLFGYFSVPRVARRVVYLIPEASRRIVAKRLVLFHLMPFVGGRLFIRTLSMGPTPSLIDPQILEAVKGADVFLDTAIRFIQGDESSSTDNNAGLASCIFQLQQAGANHVWCAHHAPKDFEKQRRMTPENILRGSGDIGGMVSNIIGIRQLDKDRNLIQVEFLQGRDMDELVKPFQIEGRPWINDTGQFKLFKKPGECGELDEEMPKREKNKKEKGGRPSPIDERVKTACGLKDEGKSLREIAQIMGVSKSTIANWLDIPESEE